MNPTTFLQMTQQNGQPVWIGYGMAITGNDTICTVHIGGGHFTLNLGAAQAVKLFNEEWDETHHEAGDPRVLGKTA